MSQENTSGSNDESHHGSKHDCIDKAKGGVAFIVERGKGGAYPATSHRLEFESRALHKRMKSKS